MIDSPHLVYCKTAKGRDEVNNRQHSLHHRQRSALILMDCAKNLGLIATAIPMPELQKAVPFLMQSGFIVLAQDQLLQVQPEISKTQPIITHDVNLVPVSNKANIVTTQTIELTENPEIIAAVKQRMSTTANTFLGLMGVQVISSIHRCHTAEQILGAAAHWHMALRESKIGTAVAMDLLAEVKTMLQSRH